MSADGLFFRFPIRCGAGDVAVVANADPTLDDWRLLRDLVSRFVEALERKDGRQLSEPQSGDPLNSEAREGPVPARANTTAVVRDGPDSSPLLSHPSPATPPAPAPPRGGQDVSRFAVALGPSARTDWRTPPEKFAEWSGKYGPFTVDAAADAENSLCAKYWDEMQDGAAQSWAGERVWCNPPFGRLAIPFIRRAALCEADIAVLLLPARTDTRIFHSHVKGIAEVEFLPGRLRFSGHKNSAPFPCMLAIYRPVPRPLPEGERP